MKQQYLITFLLILCLGINNIVGQDLKKSITVLKPISFKKEIVSADLQLIDIRTPEEYNSGHIGVARNINFYDADFIEKMTLLDKDKPLYIYCHSGGRSGQASKKLQKEGFTNIIDLEGGIVAWKKDDLSLTK